MGVEYMNHAVSVTFVTIASVASLVTEQITYNIAIITTLRYT